MLKVASIRLIGDPNVSYCNKSECVIAASAMDVSLFKVKSF